MANGANGLDHLRVHISKIGNSGGQAYWVCRAVCIRTVDGSVEVVVDVIVANFRRGSAATAACGGAVESIRSGILTTGDGFRGRSGVGKQNGKQ